MLEDDLARLEREVLGVRRVSSFLDAVELIRRLLESHPADVRQAILELTAPLLGRDLAAAVSAGFNLGTISGNALTGGAPPTEPDPPRVLVTASAKLEAEVRDLVTKARKLSRAGAPPELAVAPLLGAARKVRTGVTTLVNEAGNRGVLEAAKAAEVRVVWVAETNACVHCLAYSGRTVMPGDDWPEGLTYGAKSSHAPGKTPPLHPNCRCTLEPLLDQSYADALRREADRSVLRGFSLESESMRVRVDAAKRLLEQGVDAPKSVIAFAERSVAAGRFGTRGRPQPTAKTAPKPKPQPTKTRPTTTASPKVKASTAPPKPKTRPKTPAKPAPTPKTGRPDPRGKDYRDMSNAERLEAVRIMYGTNSPEYRAAKKRWG